MPLIANSYGKGRVRILRVDRGSERHEVRELSVSTTLEGDFGAAFTEGDNRRVIATDTIKNITNMVARENVAAPSEQFGRVLASRFLERYSQVARASIVMHETRWTRAEIGGAPHPHSFVLDGNGKGYAQVIDARDGAEITSGIDGYTFMKTTESGWIDYVMDDATSLPPTTDRIAATAMDARWTWSSAPDDYEAVNARVLETMLPVFATTYSKGIQDSLYRMGEAALAAIPELATITMACPNKHYLPINLAPFGLSADKMVFTPTDEPYGQIACTVGR